MMYFILIIFGLVCLTLWFEKRLRKVKCLTPPVMRGGLPLIGHAYILLGNKVQLWKCVKTISKDSLDVGGVLTMYIGPQTYHILSDPEDSLTVANACTNKHYSYKFAKRWLGEGLITASGATWKVHRKIISQAFTLQVLLGFMDTINVQARKLFINLDKQAGSGPFDISRDLRKMALENICLTVFGITDVTELVKSYDHAVSVILDIITTRFQTVWLHSDFVYSFTELKKKEDEALEMINKTADVIIKKKRATLLNAKKLPDIQVTGINRNALLDHLLELSDEDALTDREIREEIDTAIAAALDSTGWVLTYTLVLLGSHPEVQEKVFIELEEVLNKSDRDLGKNDLPRLVYLEAVIKESMRLYTTGPVTLRTLKKDVQLKKYTLKTGSHCIISAYGIHRHSCWGADREKFNPERWLRPETQSFVFAGFSLGRRSCIGKTYAMISLKTVLSHLLRRYKVKANASDLELKFDFILKPTKGHLVSIERRVPTNYTTK